MLKYDPPQTDKVSSRQTRKARSKSTGCPTGNPDHLGQSANLGLDIYKHTKNDCSLAVGKVFSVYIRQ